MANVSVQDIETIDDYWGPAFRSILEGSACDTLLEQLDNRIRGFDKDIERICSLYYEGFIESIRELLHVRYQAENLNREILSLDIALQVASNEVLSKANELLKSRRTENNIAIAINALSRCLPVLECYSKLHTQVKEKRYYLSLKTLEQLENEYLVNISNFRITCQIRSEVPNLKQAVKKSSEEDFREFLENIRKFSPKIGEVAMTHTKQLQKRSLGNVLHDFTEKGDDNCTVDGEDLSIQDFIDFSPIYQSIHIYSILKDKEYFEKDYRKQRHDQAKLVLQAPQAMHNNLDAYKIYICSIVGFFIVEDHIMNTAKEVVTKPYLDNLWSVSSSRAVNILTMSSSSCTDPNILLRIKHLIMLAIFTLKTYGYSVNPFYEVLSEMRDHYNEVLLQRWVNVFREILDKSDFVPLEVHTQEDFENIVEKFPFHSDKLEVAPFPKSFPFSAMVPEVYHQAKEFMYACMKFSEDLSLSLTEVATMVRQAANLLLAKSFSGCLSAVFGSPNLALMQVIQIIIDTQYLEKAGPFLDDFVYKMTKTQPNIHQIPSAMFQIARSEAEMQVSSKLCLKLDEFFEELEGYDWNLSEPQGHASPFITDMIAFLKSTFQSFSYLLPNVAQNAFKKACEHIANHIYNLIVSEEIKQISTGALQQISLDLMQCELYASSEMMPGLEGEVTKYFAEVRQLLDLLILEEWSTYLHDYGKPENRYGLVKPLDIIVVLEKMREADKKNMFSVLKKSERDKKKLWDTVLKQLKQLVDRQS